MEGLHLESVTLVDLNPEDLVPALLEGRVDAVCIWTKLVEQASGGLGHACVEMVIDDIYRAMFVVVANSQQRNLARECALLRALLRATNDLRRAPRPTLTRLSADLGITPKDIDWVIPETSFRVKLDQSLLLNLESQRRWLGLGGREIFESLSPLPLSKVDPESLDLVHPEIAP